MDSANVLCSSCKSITAQLFCACTSPETYLCERCVGKHILSKSSGKHEPWPLNQLPYYQIPGYFERLHVREETLPQVREQAWKSVAEVDKAINDYSTHVDRVISELYAYSKKVIEELKVTKAKLNTDIAAALEEVERTVMEDQPKLDTLYGPLFRDLAETPRRIQLFSYTLELSAAPPSTLVTLNSVLPSPQTLLPPPKPSSAPLQVLPPPTRLAGVYYNSAYVYEIQSKQLTQHTLSVDFGGLGVSCIEWDRDTMLCVGAYPASSAVYSLALSSFQLTPLPSLCISRAFAGIAKVNACFYVFGSWDEAAKQGSRSCEKMQISDKRWVPITDMSHPRSSFSPCHFHSLLYLASPWTTKTVETFNPQTEAFAVLPVVLPSNLNPRASVAFVVNAELCLLTEGQQMARWKIDAEREFRLFTTAKNSYSFQQPLILGSLVYITYTRTVQRFSLETYTFLD